MLVVLYMKGLTHFEAWKEFAILRVDVEFVDAVLRAHKPESIKSVTALRISINQHLHSTPIFAPG